MSLHPERDQTVVVTTGSSDRQGAITDGTVAEETGVAIGSSGKGEAAANQCGADGPGSVTDLQDEASISAFFRSLGTFDRLGRPVGDQGVGLVPSPRTISAMETMDEAQIARVWGALLALKHAQSPLASNRSTTFADGVLAHLPMKSRPSVGAFSGPMEHLIQDLAADLMPILANSVYPGPVHTERLAPWSADLIYQAAEPQPLAAAATPAGAAQAYLHLMRARNTPHQMTLSEGSQMFV